MIFWLSSIVEDTPLPDEIKKIVIVVYSEKKNKYLKFLGYEKQIDINAPAFYPLEGQYFYYKDMLTLSEKEMILRIISTIEDSFYDKGLKHEYANREIFVYYGKNLKFLFKV